MRILSLNCWSGRVPGLVDYLRSVDADIYCLQEMLHSPPGTPDLVAFEGQGSTKEVQRAKLYAELCTALPEYQGFHLPGSQGYLHDGAQVEWPAQYGLATFVRRGIPIIASASDFVFGSFRKDNWNPPPLPRNAHAVRVWDYRRDQALVVAHMHGMWMPNGKLDTPERIAQAGKFLNLISRIERSGDLVVACGDFNVLPESQTFKILENIGLKDLVVLRGFTDTRTSYYKKTVRYADYMLVSSTLQDCYFSIPRDPEVSDHRPLLLER